VAARAKAVSPAARMGRRRKRGLDMKRRVRQSSRATKKGTLTDLYLAAGAEGKSFNPLFKELGGAKKEVFPAWQAGRAKKGEKVKQI